MQSRAERTAKDSKGEESRREERTGNESKEALMRERRGEESRGEQRSADEREERTAEES